MRFRKILSALLVTCSLLLTVRAIYVLISPNKINSQKLITFSSPRVPVEHQGDIQWERKYDTDGSKVVDQGESTYLNNYRQGWQECLENFYSDIHYGDEELWSTSKTEWMTIGGPQHWNEARIDGWRVCQAELRKRLATMNPAELRQQIQQSIFENSRRDGYICLAAAVFVALLVVRRKSR